MWLGVDLQYDKDVAGIESLAANRFDRFRWPATARHYASLGGKAHFGGALVAGDQLNRQFKRGQQELCRIISRVTWGDAADFHRGFGIFQSVEAGDTAGFGKCACDVVLSGDADIFKFARVKFDSWFADHLIDHLIAMEVEDRQPIGFRYLIYVVGGE